MKTSTVTNPGKPPYLMVSHAGCVAKIYTTERQKQTKSGPQTYAAHLLTYCESGKRVVREFGKLGDAKREAELALIKIANGEAKVLEMKPADRDEHIVAVDELSKVNVPLLSAVREYCTATELLRGKATVLEAAKYYAANAMVEMPDKLTADVLEEMLRAKKRDGLSSLYLHDLKSRLGRFAEDLPGRISEIRKPQIEEWLRALDVAPRSRNNFATSVTTLFRFARDAGYLPDKPTAADNLKRAKVVDADVVIYSPDEVRAILERLAFTRPELLPFAAIAAFAGLRTAEIERLSWEQIRLNDGFIHIAAKNTKKAQRRVVPIQSNLAAWLNPYRSATGPVCPWKRPQVRVQAAVEAQVRQPDGTVLSGLNWKKNGFRHSYCSYRLPVIKNANELSLEAGNSPAMIFTHYREVVTPNAVEEYWRIVPEPTASTPRTIRRLEAPAREIFPIAPIG